MRASEEYNIINKFTQKLPVDIKGVIRALGIEYKEAYLDDDISGMLERIDSEKFKITVSATHPYTRKRFTAAHELGHYMNHRNLIGDGIDDTKAYRSKPGGQYHNTNIGPLEETEANKFAARALMPANLLGIEYVKSKDVSRLAKMLEVSERSLKWRLVNLKLATKSRMGLL